MKYVIFIADHQKKFMCDVKVKSSLTWKTIAHHLNISKDMVYCYLRADSKMPLENYKLLCDLAGIKESVQPFVVIKNKTQKISLPKYISKELAEFIGILAGDGHISGTNYHISVTGHRIDDEEYTRKYISSLFTSLFGLRPSIRIQLHNNTIKCVVNSKALFEYLTQTFYLPIGKKKGKLLIPRQIFSNAKLYNFFCSSFNFSPSTNVLEISAQYPYGPTMSVSKATNSPF